MFKRKRVLVLFIMVLSCNLLFSIVPTSLDVSSEVQQNQNRAKTLSATGYASTVAEAQDKALEKLLELIFGTSVSSVTKTNVREDSQGNSESSFSNSFNSITSGSLIGIHYTTAKKSIDGKSYEITAYIEGSSLALYTKELTSLSDEIYKEYNKKIVDLEEKKNQLITLLSLVAKFTNYRQVIISLSETTNVSDLPIGETYRSLSEQLESVYIQLMNTEEQKKQSASSSADISVIEAQISQLKAEQSALIAASTQLQIEQQRMYEQSLRESIAKMIENSVKEMSSMATGYSLEDDIDAAIQAIDKYNAMTSNLETMLQSVQARNAKELEIGVEAINSKEFRLAELSNGNPTDLAVEMRKKEVLEFSNQKKKELSEQENLIIEEYKGEIQRLYDSMVENCLTIEKRTYTLASANGDFVWFSEGYDGDTKSWNIVLGKYTGYTVYGLSYKTLTGEDPSNGQSNLEYQNYLNSVDEYDKNLSSIVSFKIELSVVFDAKNGTVQYTVSDVKVCLQNKKQSSIKISNVVNSEDIGVKVQNIDYSWLQTNKNFNAKADTENEKRAQEKAQQQKKAQEKEVIPASISSFYGHSFGSFVCLADCRISLSSIEIGGVEKFSMENIIGATLCYALSKNFLVGIEPFAGLIIVSDSSDSSNSSSDSKTSEYYYSFGALVCGELFITDFLGFGVRGGFSAKGSMVNVYAKYNYNSILYELGVAYYSLGNRFAITIGAAYAF